MFYTQSHDCNNLKMIMINEAEFRYCNIAYDAILLQIHIILCFKLQTHNCTSIKSSVEVGR